MDHATATLAALRSDFRRTSSLEMPISGTILWSLAAIASLSLSDRAMATAVLFGSGMIFPFAILLGKLRGRNIVAGGTANPLMKMFLQNLALIVLLWPFVIIAARGSDPLLIVLGGGIIMGVIWISYGWAAGTMAGLWHAVGRSIACCAAYVLAPAPFKATAICVAVVLSYALTIPALARTLKG